MANKSASRPHLEESTLAAITPESITQEADDLIKDDLMKTGTKSIPGAILPEASFPAGKPGPLSTVVDGLFIESIGDRDEDGMFCRYEIRIPGQANVVTLNFASLTGEMTGRPGLTDEALMTICEHRAQCGLRFLPLPPAPPAPVDDSIKSDSEV